MQGCPKALMGLSRAESQYGSNLLDKTTARQRNTNTSRRIEDCMHDQAQANIYVKQGPTVVPMLDDK
eukprot:7782517-Ditylum_brightwellii.AAC.1